MATGRRHPYWDSAATDEPHLPEPCPICGSWSRYEHTSCPLCDGRFDGLSSDVARGYLVSYEMQRISLRKQGTIQRRPPGTCAACVLLRACGNAPRYPNRVLPCYQSADEFGPQQQVGDHEPADGHPYAMRSTRLTVNVQPRDHGKAAAALDRWKFAAERAKRATGALMRQLDNKRRYVCGTCRKLYGCTLSGAGSATYCTDHEPEAAF